MGKLLLIMIIADLEWFTAKHNPSTYMRVFVQLYK